MTTPCPHSVLSDLPMKAGLRSRPHPGFARQKLSGQFDPAMMRSTVPCAVGRCVCPWTYSPNSRHRVVVSFRIPEGRRRSRGRTPPARVGRRPGVGSGCSPPAAPSAPVPAHAVTSAVPLERKARCVGNTASTHGCPAGRCDGMVGVPCGSGPAVRCARRTLGLRSVRRRRQTCWPMTSHARHPDGR